ncbi:hypothetical protein GMI70_06935 [Eggerthellaceae bacterium zg-893]|nr:hypothetical protein [Eggerthellaceae bacterium zg-893]
MANSIGDVVSKFTTRLDKILEVGTRTADLNMNKDLLGELSGNGEIKIAKIAMDGLADHKRGGGFTEGGMELSWETMKLEFERDRELTIDVMDDEERELIMSANVMAEFARTKVVPEVDSVRFARLSANAGNVESAALESPQAALDAVLLSEEAMMDAGKDLSDCVIYMTSSMWGLLRRSQEWRIGQGEAPNTKFSTFDDMRIRIVPKARFYTAVDLLDGVTDGEKKGGYKKADAGAQLNFITMATEAAAAITRHEKLRYFSPDVNQKDDAHLWQYRLYHDLLVYENKKDLIYAHAAAA